MKFPDYSKQRCCAAGGVPCSLSLLEYCTGGKIYCNIVLLNLLSNDCQVTRLCLFTTMLGFHAAKHLPLDGFETVCWFPVYTAVFSKIIIH